MNQRRVNLALHHFVNVIYGFVILTLRSFIPIDRRRDGLLDFGSGKHGPFTWKKPLWNHSMPVDPRFDSNKIH
jgi:hypothetical protein